MKILIVCAAIAAVITVPSVARDFGGTEVGEQPSVLSANK